MDDDVAMRRPGRLLLTVLAAVVVAVTFSIAPVHAGAAVPVQYDSPTTTIVDSEGIIPRPNSGVAPQDAGDRGGALQTALFLGMVGGIALIGGLIYRESKKARQARGF